MDIKDVRLKKGMSKEEVNELISEWLLFDNCMYFGVEYNHRWICNCGNTFDRIFSSIKSRNDYICNYCKYNKIIEKHKYIVEENGDYKYIRTFFIGDELPSGKIAKKVHLEVKHLYCGSSYITRYDNFKKNECDLCCKKYENSFAYYIEVELGLKLEDVWDFEKNTVNPRLIYKCGIEKVWIKCKEKDYHDSYIVKAANYFNGTRCPNCARNLRYVHQKDSFAQYHIDNTDKDFLTKYWDWEKNNLNPFEISPNAHIDVFIKCQSNKINKSNNIKKKDYHNSYRIECDNFTSGTRCGSCFNSKKIHPYDSFGYHNFDKVLSWHPDNDISPFRVAQNSHKKYKFICPECGRTHERILSNANNNGVKCPLCRMSIGEAMIEEWLLYNGIKYKYEKKYRNLLGVGGGNLSYDFYLPDYNILIEYQGKQHEEYIPGFHESYEDFEKQLEHDRRKFEYAYKKDLRLLEIFEKDKDNIGGILNKEIINSNKLI